MKLNHVFLIFKSKKLSISHRPREWSQQHEKGIAAIEKELTSLGIKYTPIDREEISKKITADLIIAVGGDGTVLASSHITQDTPILGVNSAPKYSVGFFCKATVDNFNDEIGKVIEDKIAPRELPLIETLVDGKPLNNLALNEILFSAKLPAETVRYQISIDGVTETHRSSGIWICAGPGSSAATLSAGGKKLQIDSSNIQFVVREPCPRPDEKYRSTHKILTSDEILSIQSEIPDAVIYIDGPRISHPIAFESKLTFRIAKRRLKIFL